MRQFILAGKALADLPIIEAGSQLQRDGLCHHKSTGAFVDLKVVRSYTEGGEEMKDEELVVSEEGDIHITSKRILMVGDGTSSVPHERILDVDVDLDRKVVAVTKGASIYLRVPDPIHCGLLIEKLSE